MRHATIALALLLAACATGRAVYGFDVESFRTLEVGKATKADVLAMAGAPLLRTPMADGAEAWTYIRSEARSTAFVMPFYAHVETVPQQKTAVLIFRGDVLERIDWTQGGPPFIAPASPAPGKK